MKKTIILASAFALLSAGGANSQNFLNKMKEKAENAVSQRIGNVTGKNNGKNSDAKRMDISDSDNGDNITITTTIVDDYKPERGGVSVNSGYVDEEKLRPATGKTFQELLSKLPPMPTAEQLANPTDAMRNDYYAKIASVRIRAEQLIEAEGCKSYAFDNPPAMTADDANAMVAQNMQKIQAMQKCFGSEKEMAEFEKESEQLEKDLAKEAKARGCEMSELEIAVFTRDKHYNLFKKELQINEAMNGVNAAAMEAFIKDWEQETKAKGRELSKAEVQALAEKKNPTLARQLKAAEAKSKSATAGSDQRIDQYNKIKEENSKVYALDQKTERDNDDALNECNKYAEKYEGQLRDIYKQIFKTSDRSQINSLYAKADEMVKDYRINAAKIWIENINSHISLLKQTLPEKVALQKEINSGNQNLECSVNQTNWQCIIQIANDMEDAFADFPEISVQPVQVSKTNIQCYRYESVFYPRVTGFAQKSRFSNSGSTDYTEQFSSDKVTPAYGTYKSPDGKRVVVFSSDGKLALPDGSIHYPVAFEQQGNVLVWYEVDFDGLSTVMEYKYVL